MQWVVGFQLRADHLLAVTAGFDVGDHHREIFKRCGSGKRSQVVQR
jgi:hypothetical protein